MSESGQIGKAMSELQKLQSEIVENSSSSSAKVVNKSTFEEFRNEQQKFNLEMVETLRMMRQEMTCGMDKIAAKKEEKQKKINEEMFENLETIEDEKNEMKEKHEKINENLLAELMNMSQDVAHLKQREHSRTPMQIFVKFMTGKAIPIQIAPANSVSTLKVMIMNKKGIPPNKQKLIFQGQQLEDNNTLQHYNIEEQSRVECT